MERAGLRASSWTFFLILFLSGCMEAGKLPVTALPDPSSLTAPRWLPGYHWEYRTDDGVWQNETVAAEETYNGRLTYRLVVHRSKAADLSGVTSYNRWVDQTNFGGVAYRDATVTVEFEPPYGQMFPMQDRYYNSSIRLSLGYQEDVPAYLGVVGWESVSTYGGVVNAVKLLTTNLRSNQTVVGWYSPQIRKIVSLIENGDEYKLASWGTKPDESLKIGESTAVPSETDDLKPPKKVKLSFELVDPYRRERSHWIFRAKLTDNNGNETGCDCNFTLQVRKTHESEWGLLWQGRMNLHGLLDKEWSTFIYRPGFCGDLVFRIVAREYRFDILADHALTDDLPVRVPC